MVTITKKTALEIAIAAINGETVDFGDFTVTDVTDKLNGMIAQLEKRTSADRKPSARQVENEGIKETVLAVLATTDRPLTVSELLAYEGLDKLSNQRLSALLRQLKEDGKVVKTTEKKKSYFALA